MARGWQHKRRKRRRVLLLLAAFILLFALFYSAERALSPALQTAAMQRAHTLAMAAMTEAIRDQIALNPGVGDYQQLMYIERDLEGRITLMVMDTQMLNRLISNVVLDAEQRLELLGKQHLTLPLLALTGSPLFAGAGPDLRFSFRMSSAPLLTLEDEFTEAGVNQTRHRIYVELTADLRVVAPFSQAEERVTATVLLAEGIILGYTPDTYVNLGK